MNEARRWASNRTDGPFGSSLREGTLMNNVTRRRLSGEEPRTFKVICSMVSGVFAGATRALTDWMLGVFGR